MPLIAANAPLSATYDASGFAAQSRRHCSTLAVIVRTLTSESRSLIRWTENVPRAVSTFRRLYPVAVGTVGVSCGVAVAIASAAKADAAGRAPIAGAHAAAITTTRSRPGACFLTATNYLTEGEEKEAGSALPFTPRPAGVAVFSPLRRGRECSGPMVSPRHFVHDLAGLPKTTKREVQARLRQLLVPKTAI